MSLLKFHEHSQIKQRIKLWFCHYKSSKCLSLIFPLKTNAFLERNHQTGKDIRRLIDIAFQEGVFKCFQNYIGGRFSRSSFYVEDNVIQPHHNLLTPLKSSPVLHVTANGIQ